MFRRAMSILVGAGLLAGSPSLWAEGDVANTGWLELVKGSRGDEMGAEVREVETDPEDPSQKKLVIAIPKVSMNKPPSEIEEVRVVGQAPEESGPLFDFKYETQWLTNYDDDYYGLLIRLGENPENWPIRLFMHSDKGPRENQRDLSGQ